MRIDKPRYLRTLAVETARMSYPGRMGSVLRKGAKQTTMRYFAHEFQLIDLWRSPAQVAHSYDKWHRQQSRRLALRLEPKLVKKNFYTAQAAAAKLINTFHHQLMKYERFRPLYRFLHLPLDQIVFRELRRWAKHEQSQALKPILPLLRRNPYTLTYREYMRIQTALAELLPELRRDNRLPITSRVDLNPVLWAR